MLKEINSTIIALIPKKEVPESVADFRLISCSNVLYKCITKVITFRMREVVDFLVGPQQGAFIQNRSIHDNILQVHELATVGRMSPLELC